MNYNILGCEQFSFSFEHFIFFFFEKFIQILCQQDVQSCGVLSNQKKDLLHKNKNKKKKCLDTKLFFTNWNAKQKKNYFRKCKFLATKANIHCSLVPFGLAWEKILKYKKNNVKLRMYVL